MSEKTKELVRQGNQFLQEGHIQQAFDSAAEAISEDSNDANAWMLKGISAAQLGLADQASDSFRKTIELDPANPKAFYNFATHLYQVGKKQESQAMASEALRLDPGYRTARDLIGLIEAEEDHVEAPPIEALPSPDLGPPAEFQRPIFKSPVHSIGFIGAIGKSWPALGWLLSFGTLALTVGSVIFFYDPFTKILQDQNKYRNDSAAAQALLGPAIGPVFLTGLALLFLTLVWMILDLADQRGGWIWIVPLLICNVLCICVPMFGIGWVILPLYLLFGRKS